VYEVRGMLATVTSYDNTAGTGTPVNQVGLEYNNYGLLTKDAQSHAGAVSGGTPAVLYTYAGTSTSNSVRRTKITGHASTGYDYGATGGINDRLSRVESVVDSNDGSVTAEYTYIGTGSAVRLDYGEPQVMLDLWGGTSGQFDGVDRFGRVIDQRWKSYGGSPTDLDRYQYGYDRNSNRLWKQNMVATTGFDEQYAVDNLNRLGQMKRGTLNGSHVIPGTPVKQQDWGLDPVGNWNKFTEDASGTAVLDQTRTASTVNEITSIGTGTGALPVWATPAYDAAGNMTGFVNPAKLTANLTAIYDAWNRLVAVKDGASFVAAYAYDGLRRRVVKKSYSGGSLKETRDFYFSDQWQVLSEAVGGAVDKTYAWGLRYVDELLWRFDSAWKRSYAMQDANGNCTAICDTSGAVQERYQYDPYGNRVVLNPSWAVITSSAYNWDVAHQGLVLETSIGLYDCRNRLYVPSLGVWIQRDPQGYGSGSNLYEYLLSNPLIYLDPLGEQSSLSHPLGALEVLVAQLMAAGYSAAQIAQILIGMGVSAYIIAKLLNWTFAHALAATIIAAYGQEVLDWINQYKQRLLDKWNAMGKAAGCAAAEAAYNSFCKPLAGCGKWSKTPPKNCNLLLNAATSAVICLAAREFIAKMGCPSGHKTPESLIETITNTIAKCYSMYIDCLNKAKTNTPPGPTACGQPKEDPTLVWV
jgi:RHS repeat-associated protein